MSKPNTQNTKHTHKNKQTHRNQAITHEQTNQSIKQEEQI